MGNLNPRNYKLIAKDGSGVLTITGLPLEECHYYAPLGKIYSSCRKRNAEQFGIQVTGTFLYDFPEKGTITGSFHPNCYDCNDEEARINKVLHRFDETFERQMTLFIDVVECFMDDKEQGYSAYLKHIEHINFVANNFYESENERQVAIEAAIEECNQMFDSFLISIGVKTNADLKRRNKNKSRFAKAKKELDAVLFNK
ncbi:hypothetical protein IJJ02_02645 [Candidatus Saccharibacteria bacterium]|nr:hypothetical protein [Candidatus Saccharibacteria bacterium]